MFSTFLANKKGTLCKQWGKVYLCLCRCPLVQVCLALFLVLTEWRETLRIGFALW